MAALYAPYKAIGMVTDGNPFVVNRLGDETFLMTSIGSMFQVYRLDHLTLCLASQSVIGRIKAAPDKPISCLQAVGTETFAAVGSAILVFDRTRIVRTYDLHAAPILGMLVVGKLLLSYDEAGVVNVIDTKQRSVVSKLESTRQGGAHMSTAVHPATYLNKFVFGYTNGALELWNINKRALVYTFASHVGFFADASEVPSGTVPAVTALEQSPACDVVGVGFATGHILLLNLKLDLVLFSFRQDSGGVTSLSFRTDASVHPHMASGSTDGRVHIWNLGAKNTALDADDDSDDDRSFRKLERKLQNTIEECHGGHVSRVYFLHGEPILVTASADNSLKVRVRVRDKVRVRVR